MGLLNRGQPQARRARIHRPGKSLTASAESGGRKAGALRKLSQPWQLRALGFYDTIGECWYPAQFYARAMKRIRFFPAVLDERGEPQEIESGPLVDLFARVQDPGGGISELPKSYGQLQFLIGDGYLTVSQDGDAEEAWEYLSPLELKIDPDGDPRDAQSYRRIRAPGIPTEQLVEAPDSDFSELEGSDVRVWRLWRRHPSYSQWSDSPVKGVLELYELLARLTLAAGAESTSRAAQRGMLFIPEELTFGGADDGDPDEDPESDPLMQEFIEGMMSAIRDPGSAAAMAPFFLRGPGVLQTDKGSIAMADAIKWIPLGPNDRYTEGEMWDKTINRIAGGLDMPREMVDAKGIGAVNHWGSWLLDEQGFRQHVAGVVEDFCSDITAAYLKPAAIDAGIENADRVVVWYDPAAAINHPDEIKTAREGFRDGVVSSDYYRDKIGATSTDVPTEEDLALILALQGKTTPADTTEQDGETSPADGGRGGDTVEQPPQDEPTQDGPANGVVASARAKAGMAMMILGAAEIQVERAREAAGARLVSRSKGCAPCREKIRDVPHTLVASALGPDQVREIIDGHTNEAGLVAGAGDTLAAKVRQWGVRGELPGELGRLVEQHALRTLYETSVPPLPSGFRGVVEKALR